MFSRLQFSGILNVFQCRFCSAMQTSFEYIKYDIEEYHCPMSSISMRRVHVNMILIKKKKKKCYSR